MNSLAVVAMGGAAAEAMHYPEVAPVNSHCAMRLGWSSQLLDRGAQRLAISQHAIPPAGSDMAALFMSCCYPSTGHFANKEICIWNG